MKQRDLIYKLVVEEGRTISVAKAYVDYHIMNVSSVISHINKEFKEEESDLHINKYVNDTPNANGEIIPYVYYYLDDLRIEPNSWPAKRTNFQMIAGESKTNAVIRFMKENNGKITTLDGYTEILAFRIGAIIHRLRKDGYIISTKKVLVNGHPRKIAEYTLISDPVVQ